MNESITINIPRRPNFHLIALASVYATLAPHHQIPLTEFMKIINVTKIGPVRDQQFAALYVQAISNAPSAGEASVRACNKTGNAMNEEWDKTVADIQALCQKLERLAT